MKLNEKRLKQWPEFYRLVTSKLPECNGNMKDSYHLAEITWIDIHGERMFARYQNFTCYKCRMLKAGIK